MKLSTLPKWCKYKYKKKQCTGRYDFYFEKDNIKYIVEMDGYFHYKKNPMKGNRGLIDSKHVDKTKDRLALKHENIKVIRINCLKSELEYIKSNIIDSVLFGILDLNCVNWLKCEEYAVKNVCKEICKYKKENYSLTTTDIGKIFRLSNTTIRTYLKKGNILGWVDYNNELEAFIWKEKVRQNNKKRWRKVQMYKDDILVGTFASLMELERKSIGLFGTILYNSNTSKVCNNKKPLYKGYFFKYIDNNNINPVPIPLFKPQLCLPLPKELHYQFQ